MTDDECGSIEPISLAELAEILREDSVEDAYRRSLDLLDERDDDAEGES